MISNATKKDIPALNELINSAYRGESSKQGWTTEAHLLEGLRTSEDELSVILKDPKNTILKYVVNNQIIACVLLSEKQRQLYLGMLTVSPIFQNSGIGKQLMQKAEDFAINLNLHAIIMTVISVRVELISYYVRKGYFDTGLREPFPVSDLFTQIANKPLEFIVLEKKLL